MNIRTIAGTAIVSAVLLLSGAAHAQPSACTPRASGGGARIEEASFVPLGGIEQFVTIRGDDRSNPVLLHVHGGPGISFSAFTTEFAPYQTEFTVVQWDQRGSGCTFGRHGESTPDPTLHRIASDGVELAEYLRGREHFALYVGTAQFTSFTAIVEAQIAHLRRVAAGDAELTKQLDALASLDSNILQKFGGVNRLLAGRVPAQDAAFMQGLQSRAAQVMAATELADWQAGRQLSTGQLLPQIAGVDLLAAARRVEVPFVVIQGSDDLNTPTEAARAYFDQVEAPTKELVVIDGAGHFPHLTHTPQFLSALRKHSNGAFTAR